MKKNYFTFLAIIMIGMVFAVFFDAFTPYLGFVALFTYAYFKYYISPSQENLNSIRKVLHSSSISTEELEAKTGIPSSKIELLKANPQYSEMEISLLVKELGITPAKKSPTKFYIFIGIIFMMIFLVYFVFL